MPIQITYNNDLSELYQELDSIENGCDEEIIEPPPFRNEFSSVADIKEYLSECKRYREYLEARQSESQKGLGG